MSPSSAGLDAVDTPRLPEPWRSRGVLALPRAAWGTLSVSGPERLEWLSGLVTCDVKPLQPGECTWGLALDRKGKIKTELWCFELAEQTLIAVAPGSAEPLLEHFDSMLVMEDAELKLASEDWHWSVLLGEGAQTVARSLAERVDPRSEGGLASWDRLGVPSVLMVSPAPLALPEEEEELAPLGVGAVLSAEEWLQLRLRLGIAEFGVDFGQKERPHEASLERKAVSWSKGCYLGQEVVCMQDMRGKVKRHLVSLYAEPEVVTPGAVPAPGSELFDSKGVAVGHVTSIGEVERGKSWSLIAMLNCSAEQGAIQSEGGVCWKMAPSGADW